jgi:hypothetical protein
MTAPKSSRARKNPSFGGSKKGAAGRGGEMIRRTINLISLVSHEVTGIKNL